MRLSKRNKWILIGCALLLLVTALFYEPLWYRILGAADTALNRIMGLEEPIELKENTAEIHIIDVGQADAIVVTCGEKAMLVDAGESASADRVVRYIASLGIKHFDKVIATHPHSDHIGGMTAVLDRFGTDEIIMPYAISETREYDDLLTKISALGLSVTEPQPGTEIPFGDAVLTMLSPDPAAEWEELNNESVMFLFSFNGVRMLFTGDAETEAENSVLSALYDIDCDLMKVPHHGSKTSSGDRFLDAASPKYAFVTCETDSRDNLPVKEVLDRYRDRGCTVYRTDKNGTIVITIDETGAVSIDCTNDTK